MLQGLAPGYIHARARLDRARRHWDFTLSFSTAASCTAAAIAAGEELAGAGPQRRALAARRASEATRAETGIQKRPVQVLVIDHVEQKPTDN